nr:MAG TPA: DNA-binding protein [Caudoviricetes sp.]
MPTTKQKEIEFCSAVSRYCDNAKEKVIRKIWKAITEHIIREIYYKNTCEIPLLGRFDVRKMEEKIQRQTTANGKEIEYVVPARIVPVFIPSDDFIDDVNGGGVTKSYRKRLKNNALTSRDYERMVRTEQMESNGRFRPTEEELQQARDDFREMLAAKAKRQSFKKTKE